ncbi:MAG: hypothetical protein M0Z59_03155 [Nitrospiraceae bacterium]|nr:hypothetical protein [Nitrospiraceae bacterium]
MAEIKLTIEAEDRASDVFMAVAGAVDNIGSAVSDAALRTGSLGDALDALPLSKTLYLDVSEAVQAASAVSAALESIPDISYKDVILRYFTQASPVMPFSEGMEMIGLKMKSLPVETTHTVRFFTGLDGGAQPTVKGGGNISIGPFYFNGKNPPEALQIEAQIADSIKSGRSPIVAALAKAGIK